MLTEFAERIVEVPQYPGELVLAIRGSQENGVGPCIADSIEIGLQHEDGRMPAEQFVYKPASGGWRIVSKDGYPIYLALVTAEALTSQLIRVEAGNLAELLGSEEVASALVEQLLALLECFDPEDDRGVETNVRFTSQLQFAAVIHSITRRLQPDLTLQEVVVDLLRQWSDDGAEQLDWFATNRPAAGEPTRDEFDDLEAEFRELRHAAIVELQEALSSRR